MKKTIKKIKKEKKDGHSTIIQNCSFNGVSWDKSSLEVVSLVAKGLVNLSDLFKSQNVQIDALLKIPEHNSK